MGIDPITDAKRGFLTPLRGFVLECVGFGGGCVVRDRELRIMRYPLGYD